RGAGGDRQRVERCAQVIPAARWLRTPIALRRTIVHDSKEVLRSSRARVAALAARLCDTIGVLRQRLHSDARPARTLTRTHASEKADPPSRETLRRGPAAAFAAPGEQKS